MLASALILDWCLCWFGTERRKGLVTCWVPSPAWSGFMIGVGDGWLLASCVVCRADTVIVLVITVGLVVSLRSSCYLT